MEPFVIIVKDVIVVAINGVPEEEYRLADKFPVFRLELPIRDVSLKVGTLCISLFVPAGKHGCSLMQAEADVSIWPSLMAKMMMLN